MAMKNLPLEAHPREKLIARGPQALGDTELLALLLRTGMAGKNVLALAEELLAAFGGISGLLHATAPDLLVIKGMGGTAKRAQVLAVLELARRALAERIRLPQTLSDPKAVKDYLRLQLGSRRHEVFAVLFLDAQHRLIALEELFRGTLTQSCVYPREVALRALHHHAAAVILAHNHPSGTLMPSPQDVAVTQHLRTALGLFDILVLDHIIVAQGGTCSMAEAGLIRDPS